MERPQSSITKIIITLNDCAFPFRLHHQPFPANLYHFLTCTYSGLDLLGYYPICLGPRLYWFFFVLLKLTSILQVRTSLAEKMETNETPGRRRPPAISVLYLTCTNVDCPYPTMVRKGERCTSCGQLGPARKTVGYSSTVDAFLESRTTLIDEERLSASSPWLYYRLYYRL